MENIRKIGETFKLDYLNLKTVTGKCMNCYFMSDFCCELEYPDTLITGSCGGKNNLIFVENKVGEI